MRYRHSLLGVVVAISLAPVQALGSDKTSLACIQASDAAQTERDAGNLLHARELFAECAATKCPALIRRDCTSWVEQVQAQIPSVVLGAHDSQGRDVLDARIAVDGHPLDKRVDGGPLELNPGPHVIRWDAPGWEPVELRIALRLQEKNRPVVATVSSPLAGTSSATSSVVADGLASNATGPRSPEAPSDFASSASGLPLGAYVVGGIGIAALGTFGYFGLRAKRDSDALHDTCAPGCSHADVEALKTKLVIADVALGIGVVSIAAATLIVLRSRGTPATSSTWDVRMGPTEGGAHADVAVRF